jgi:hypothetical protein
LNRDAREFLAALASHGLLSRQPISS